MIKVIEKALNILELLAGEQDREISLGEIASTLNMDRGTCSNIRKNRKNASMDAFAMIAG